MTGGILSGPEILNQVAAGRIQIDPLRQEYVNPASVDLTLGPCVKIYSGTYQKRQYTLPEEDGRTFLPLEHIRDPLDSKQSWATDDYTMSEKGWCLYPGVCYLMHTTERVRTDHFVPVLDGKSSVGRVFIKVHETAGYGDPGFDGQYTLEVSAQIPIRVYPGMRFCQIRFHTLVGEPLLYSPQQGHYTGPEAQGAVASQISKQFTK